MRYVRFACIVVVAIFCGVSVLIATSDDSLESFDPYHPATLLPIVAKRLDALRAQARAVDVGELLDAAIVAFRGRIRHESPPESPSR
jgi:hypothetical protein